jgi:2-dehydro-3-deoxyphosphogluconate aldolase / (4S)-4-hydroxy-2-oxoglutarate aldolase
MTDPADFFTNHLGTTPVMAILRGHGPARTLELCHRAWELGLALVEIPVQNDDDLESLRAAVAAGRPDGHVVGAGTVTSPGLVGAVAEVGAAFTVAPGLDEEVLVASHAAGLPHLPGVATATEIHHAVRLGLVWLKAFPAAALGPSWFAAMAGPFPQIRLLATGGVDAGNAATFLDAGAAAASLGSAFADVAAEDVRRLTSRG